MTGDEILGVLASLAVALIVGVFSLVGVRYSLRAQEKSEETSRQEEAERLMRKYRDPLVRATFDLQSRLYNIVANRFLETYYLRGTEAEKHYAYESTLYVIGEFFGWVEIMRREIQFLDLRDIARNRELASRLDDVSGAFLSVRDDSALRVFRGEQRAIGEVMTAALPSGGRECIGYAAFVQRRDDPEFARWFTKLGEDVELLATQPGGHHERAAAIQRALIDLIDFLDPAHQYFPDSRRRKLPTPEALIAASATMELSDDPGPAIAGEATSVDRP